MAVLHIEVRTLAGTVVGEFSLEASDTVGKILQRLNNESTHIKHWLAFGGQKLHLDATLASAGIQDCSVIYLLTGRRIPAQLSVNYNDALGSDGITALADHIAQSCSLRSLDLGNCGLRSCQGGKAIAQAAHSCGQRLEELKLQYNGELGAEGIQQVAQLFEKMEPKTKLEMLDVGACGLTGVEGGLALASLAKTLPSLQKLHLFGNPKLGSCGLLAAVSSLSRAQHLQILDIGYCGFVGRQGARTIGEAVQVMTGLKELYISGNQICSYGLEALLNFLPAEVVLETFHFEGIGLSGCIGGTVAARVVQQLGQIKVISLSDNSELGSTGIFEFAISIPETNIVTEIHLARVSLSDEGGGKAVATVFDRCDHLEELSILANYGLGTLGISALALDLSHEPKLRSLDISMCGISEPNAIEDLARVLSACRTLETLSLQSNDFRSQGLSQLRVFLRDRLRVTSLHIGDCGLTSAEGASALVALIREKLPYITELGLMRSQGLGFEGFSVLAHELPSAFAAGSEQLKALGLEGCGLAGNDGGAVTAKLVCALPGVEDLGLCGNDELGNEGLNNFVAGLPVDPPMRWLELEDCGLHGEQGGLAVAMVVQAMPFLEHLGLAKNELLSSSGLVAFVEALKGYENMQLASLIVDSCGLVGASDGSALGAIMGMFAS